MDNLKTVEQALLLLYCLFISDQFNTHSFVSEIWFFDLALYSAHILNLSFNLN